MVKILGSGDMGNMMGQIQNFQKRMVQTRENLKNEKITAVGGGFVEVTLNGKGEVLRVSINERAVQKGMAFLEEQMMLSVNEGFKKARQREKEKIGELLREMNIPNIPGIFDLF